MTKNILISGAGVTGLALAYWLDRAGFAVTIVERAPGFRRGGQAVDIRGVALDVIKAMGLHREADALRTRSRGMSILDANCDEIGRTEERTFSAGRLDSPDIEIFRDDLCEILMRALSSRVTLLYDNGVRAVVQREDGVDVTLNSGHEQRFDYLLGADGVYSHTRKLCFDDEANVVKPLNVVLALFSTPNFIDLKHWQLAHREGEDESEDAGIGFVIYPSRDQDTLRVGVGYGTTGAEVARNDGDGQRNMVAAKCAKLGGFFPKLIEAMRVTDQFYYNELAQVHMPAWSKGRVVLAGDAAHCASPFTGQGTSLALVGALVLARALMRRPDQPTEVFAAYEQRMRPYVKLNQALLDLHRKGPVPDEQMTAAKNGIELGDLLGEVA
jgi:2-polyprenyl-6-methoxyphenol hydroxylase-like FAD-dependent oxidoreductase